MKHASLTLAAGLLAGCLAQPGDEVLDDGAPPAADDGTDAPRASIDARAAAARGIMTDRGLEPAPPITASLTSFYSGTIPVGATYTFHWNNAALDHTFHIDVSPVGATTSNDCEMEVTREWDVQHYSGEREHHFAIKNTGPIACGANVLITSRPYLFTWSLGGLAPGASTTHAWKVGYGAFFANVSPSGATSGADCQLEVTREWYTRNTAGSRYFYFTIKNIGSIACQGSILLARATDSIGGSEILYLLPGNWLHASAGTVTTGVYVTGVEPSVPYDGTCAFEVLGQESRQRVTDTGQLERRVGYRVKNVGGAQCSAVTEVHRLP